MALLSMLTLVATAMPALAHHPEVEASATCDDGQIVVSYTARTWTASGSAGLHDDVRVGYSWSNPGGGSEATTPPFEAEVGQGAFTDANGREFSGSFILPASDAGKTVHVTSWAVGSWENGQGGNEFRSTSVTLPGECEPPTVVVPPAPSGELVTECGSWSAPVSVAPLGDNEVAEPESVLFEVFEGDVLLASVTLEPGESDTLSGMFGEDTGDHDIRLVVAGEQTDTATVETDCDAAPAAALGDECAVGGIEVLLSNPDVPSVEFSVYSGDELVETVELSETSTSYVVLVPAAEGETVDITVVVTGDQELLLAEQVTRDCEEPVVTTETCSPDGDLVVTVGELPADDFVIMVDGETLDEPIIRTTTEPTTEWAEVFDLEDGTYTVTVLDGTETVVYEQDVVIDCDEPVVVVSAVECTEDGGTVTVTVDETPEDSFTVTIDGTTVDVVDGEATVTGLEDGTYTIVVTDGDGTVVHEETIVVDCDEPVVVVSSECDAEDGTVTVVTTETPDETFTVTIGDQSQQTSGGTVTFEGLEDGEVSVTITSDQGYEQVVDLVVACDDETQVGGDVVEPPAPNPAPAPAPDPDPAPQPQVDTTDQLPATGVAANVLVLLAMLLMALGGTVVMGSQQPRRQA